MKIALINAGKWELAIKGRSMSKAHEATLTLGSLRQRARATGRTLYLYQYETGLQKGMILL
jgi:hypothetical protein